MSKEIRNIICAVIAAALAIGFISIFFLLGEGGTEKEKVKVGFIYDGDAGTPYSANFMIAARSLTAEYGEKAELIEKYNIPHENAAEIIDGLVSDGCDIIFTTSFGYGDAAKKAAQKYSEVQFCAATCDNSDVSLENYHTFMGEICQGRYVSGVLAGRKLKEMIDSGIITAEQAVVGYVAAYPVAEVISGYTAFLLGVRSECPNAVMHVRYTNSWTDFSLEKRQAERLIDDGCVIISHHTNTIGSAIACENASMPYTVYHVGYNQDMMNAAPTASLTSCRIDWTPYIKEAVGAVLSSKEIEKTVKGNVHGKDMSGGFREGWVSLIDINTAAVSKEDIKFAEETVNKISSGKISIFKGDYKGTDPEDPNDTIDLNTEFIENKDSSAPSFHYILQDIVIIDN